MELITLTNISKHLTDDVINKVFNLKTNSKEKIKSVEVMRGAPAGEGLISAVYRIKVTGDVHTANFIVKALVKDSLLRRSFNSTVLFKREVDFFSKILPALIEIQSALGAKERIQNNLPVCYGYHVDGKNDYILMEDLLEKKFTSMSVYPTKRERDMTLKVLAHLHSVSLALRIKKPDIFNKITSGLNEIYYNDANRDWYAKYLQGAIAIDKNVLAEYEGTNGIYYKKFERLLEDDVYEQLIRLTSTRGDHPMLNHGDAWCPNFLCSKDKVVALDFQILRCASPVTDLSYFLCLCSNLCQSKDDFIEAIDVYYAAFEFYLKDMGLDVNSTFPYDALKQELYKFGKFGLLAALSSIPLMASERCDVLQSFEERYSGHDKIPLEELWKLSPITAEEHKLRLVNAVHVAVDVGLI